VLFRSLSPGVLHEQRALGAEGRVSAFDQVAGPGAHRGLGVRRVLIAQDVGVHRGERVGVGRGSASEVETVAEIAQHDSGRVGPGAPHVNGLLYFRGMSFGEADTRAKLIDPALHARGWTEDLIRREETAGAIEIIEGKPRKRSKGRVEYTLRVRVNPDTQPVAVALIEAKAEDLPPTHGLEQAKL